MSPITSPTTLGTWRAGYAYALKSDGSLDYSTEAAPAITSSTSVPAKRPPRAPPIRATPSSSQSDGDTSVQTIGTNDLTIDALAGSNGLNLLLGTGVTVITLADYAHGVAPTSTSPATARATPLSATTATIPRSGRRQRPLDADRRRRHGHLRLWRRLRRGDDHRFRSGQRLRSVQGDTIDLVEETNVNSFSDVQSDAISVDANGNADPNGPDTLINFGNGDTLMLDGVTPLAAGGRRFYFHVATSLSDDHDYGADV